MILLANANWVGRPCRLAYRSEAGASGDALHDPPMWRSHARRKLYLHLLRNRDANPVPHAGGGQTYEAGKCLSMNSGLERKK